LIEEQSEIVNLDPGLEGEHGDGSGPVSVMIIGNNNVFEVIAVQRFDKDMIAGQSFLSNGNRYLLHTFTSTWVITPAM
jgi:hypothetical protein